MQNTKAMMDYEKNERWYERKMKRLFDLIIACLLLFILSPILICLCILIKIKLGNPVIFKQNRPGLHEKVFTMYKFRTMTNDRDEYGEFLPDNLRLTKFGKFLRSTSLDELPELWNVIRGEMSLVGPRPQLLRDVVFMTSEHRKRHSVLPGLTGWAQVNGRNNLSWEDKLDLDLIYLNHISFLYDFKIIARTFVKVLSRENINSEGMVTSEDFGDYLLREKKISWDEYRIAIESCK
ncbi:sugar transferase [Paenibacillus cymbidii]|uniref:sugar transferase n=1 Tax=Paenibacillus cymbidii TaxID=1639034 RepID=UPI002E261FB7